MKITLDTYRQRRQVQVSGEIATSSREQNANVGILSPDITADANNNVVDLGVKSLQPEAQLIDVDALVCVMDLCSDEEYAQPISDGELEIFQPVAEDTRSVRVERLADVETGTILAVRQSKLPPASVLREYISGIVKSSSKARKGVNCLFRGTA